MAKRDISPKRWQKLAGILKEGYYDYDMDDQRGIGQSEVDGDLLGELESDLVDEVVQRMQKSNLTSMEDALHWAEVGLQDVLANPADLGYGDRDSDMIWDDFGDPEDLTTPSDEKIKDVAEKAFSRISGAFQEDRENWGDMDGPYEHEHDHDDQRGIAQSEISGEAHGQLEDDLVEEIVKSAQRENPDLSRLNLKDFEDHAEEVLNQAIEQPDGADMSPYMGDWTVHAGEAFNIANEEAVKEMAMKAMDKANNDTFNLHVGEALDIDGMV